MKILFITDLYPIQNNEIHTSVALHNFVSQWIKQGHSVDVIKPNFIFNSFLRGKPFYKTGFYKYEGVKIFNVNYHLPFFFDITKKLGQKRQTACLPAFLPSYPPDIIIAHMPSGIIFANKLAQKYNKPLICAVHSSDIEVLTNPIYKFYFKPQLENAYKNAKKIACRSFALQKKFNLLFPDLAEKTFVATSGVDNNLSLREASIASDEAIQKEYFLGLPRHELKFIPRNDGTDLSIKIITCANLIKRKNIDKLILAIKELEGFELKIIGDGKERKHLEKLSLVGSPIHQNIIRFLGHLPQKKVFEEMQKADIFVLPSVNETFGMVYLEAMASGCITVCTKNDGIDGIIRDGENGFLTEPSIKGIKETLLKIKNISNLEQIRENSLNTVKNYTMEKCAEHYLKNII